MDDEEELSKYINIYSANQDIKEQGLLSNKNLANKKKLEMGCPTQFNYTKFVRPKGVKSRFCIDEENDYELEGNFAAGKSKLV